MVVETNIRLYKTMEFVNQVCLLQQPTDLAEVSQKLEVIWILKKYVESKGSIPRDGEI